MANPIQLLIDLKANHAKSKSNIDMEVLALKKYYDRNPLLINLDINKSLAIKNIDNFINQLSKKKIEIDIDVKNGKGSSELTQMNTQAKQLTQQFDKIKNTLSSNKAVSAKSFDIDLDRAIIQIENLGRKGIVAKGDIEQFKSSIESLRGTTNRLGLKEVSKDMTDVSSRSNHADKVMTELAKSLTQVTQAQQKLTSTKDKLSLDANTQGDYSKLSRTVNTLIGDITRLQSQASSGGTDEIKLAGQIREITNRVREAKTALSNFGVSADTRASFEKTTESAKKLHAELSRNGTVSTERLSAYSNAITNIGNSSLSTEAKIMHLNRAMESVKDSAKNVKFNERFADGIQRSTASLNSLETKLKNLENSKSVKYDTQSLADATVRLNALRTSLAQVQNPQQLQGLNRQFRELSNEVRNLEGRSNSLGNALSQAFTKFPIWMLASTAFYAPIRGIQDLTEKVFMLDEAMISLARVSDLSDFQLNQVLEKSIQNVDTLSAKTADYLELVNQFTRTGKNDTESLALANTATILQNISDLDAKQTFDSLTAAQIAFNIEAEKSITIADKLNEVN